MASIQARLASCCVLLDLINAGLHSSVAWAASKKPAFYMQPLQLRSANFDSWVFGILSHIIPHLFSTWFITDPFPCRFPCKRQPLCNVSHFARQQRMGQHRQQVIPFGITKFWQRQSNLWQCRHVSAGSALNLYDDNSASGKARVVMGGMDGASFLEFIKTFVN